MKTMQELLTLDDIASLWGVTRRHARDVLVKAPDFPPIAPGASARLKRWARREIEAYINREPKDDGQSLTKP